MPLRLNQNAHFHKVFEHIDQTSAKAMTTTIEIPLHDRPVARTRLAKQRR